MKKKKMKKWVKRWFSHLPAGPPGPRGDPGTCGPEGPPGMVNWGEFNALFNRVSVLESWAAAIEERLLKLEKSGWGKRVK